jgi:hypothetical protein
MRVALRRLARVRRSFSSFTAKGFAMTKTYRISVILLSAAVVFAMSNSPAAFGQRFRGGDSNQANKEKKDKDNDEKKDQKKSDGNNQGNQGNQTNQGSNQKNKDNDNQNNQGNTRRDFGRNPTNRGEANKSGNSNSPSQLQQLIQGGKNQNDKDKKDSQGQNNQGQNIQGQGGRFFNPGQQGFPGNSRNQQVIIGGAGNAEPANRKLGRWQGDRWEGTRKADNWNKAFGNNHQLFSSQWYKDHPQAWKYNNNKANVWVVATVPGVYSWLGWGSVPQQYRVGYGRVEQFDHSHYGDWYPLGVYSLMSGEGDIGSRIVQLAVDQHGHINGNYFDMIANSDHGISGDIDRQSQRAEFWLNRNPKVRFRVSIARLLQPYGSITVRIPVGDQRWQFVRMEN